MLRALLYVVQTAAANPGDAPSLPAFSTIPRCPRDTGDGDVVVCGTVDRDRYRLKSLPPRYRSGAGGLPEAKVPLGGGTLSATAEQGGVGGVATNRAMLTWKLKF